MTCNQLLSVPYALYAETSGSSTPGPQGIQETLDQLAQQVQLVIQVQQVQPEQRVKWIGRTYWSNRCYWTKWFSGSNRSNRCYWTKWIDRSHWSYRSNVCYSNHDWYEANLTSAPNDINDDIYTNGNVGVSKTIPQTSLDLVGTATITNQSDGGVLFRFKYRAKLAI